MRQVIGRHVIGPHLIGRRAALAAGLALLAAPALGQARPKARPDRSAGGAVEAVCRDAIAAANLGGAVGYAVADLTTGQMLGGQRESAVMPPASVTKAVTTLFVLDRFAASHRIFTRVLATGPVQGGVLQGDLILAGGGDPSFDTDRMGDLVAALAQTGLARITGQFLVYGGALPYAPRIAGDQPDFVGYNPAVSGMMLNYNRANFVWAGGNGAGGKKGMTLAVNAEGKRFIPPVRAVEVVAAQRETPLFAYEAKTPVERWSVAAPALQRDGSRWLPVRAPLAYAGDVFAALAAAHGLDLPPAGALAALPANAAVLAADRSETLDKLLAGMLKYSTNLTAEALGLAASQAVDLAASGAAMTKWAQARFGISARFGDHSGLGPLSACTPADMVAVMLEAKATALPSLLRERGVDAAGREAKDGALRVFAKSGTLNFASNLAGYVRGPNGRGVAFAIFAADSARRAALPEDQREDPDGGAAWTKRARAMQRALIAAWGAAYLSP